MAAVLVSERQKHDEGVVSTRSYDKGSPTSEYSL